MDKQIIPTKKEKIEWLSIIVLGLLFLPYLFSFGEKLFIKLGKYYYAILIVLIVAYTLFFKSYKYYKNPKSKDYKSFKVKHLFIISLFAFLVVYMFLTYFNKNSLNNIIFCAILVIYILAFSLFEFNDKTMLIISFFSTCLLFYFALNTIIKDKYQTFNPNSYSYIVTCLVFFALPSLLKNKSLINVIISVFIIGLSIYLVEFKYKCETQFVALLLFVAFTLFSKLIFKNKTFYIIFISAVVLFVILFAFIITFLINNKILSEGFINSRGLIYVDSTEHLLDMSLFNTFDFNSYVFPTKNESFAHPHNGFLDTCFKFTPFGAILFFFAVYFILISFYDIIKLDFISKYFVLVVLTCLCINTVESVFISLSDSYFMFLALSIIVARSNKIALKKEKEFEFLGEDCNKQRVKKD